MAGKCYEDVLATQRIWAEQIKKEEATTQRFQKRWQKEQELKKLRKERLQPNVKLCDHATFLKSLVVPECRHSYRLKADELSDCKPALLPPCPMCLSRTCPVCGTWTENTLQFFYKPCACCNYQQCQAHCLPKHCTVLATDNYHGVEPNVQPSEYCSWED